MSQDFVLKITLLDNNELSILLTINAESQNYTKHIDIIYHFVMEVIEDRKLEVNWVSRLVILTNAMTKSLSV